MTQGYQLYHSLSLSLLKHFFDNALLENDGLPYVLPLAVHPEQVEGVILREGFILKKVKT